MNLLLQTENAIQTFYHCQNQVERHAAHQWLLELQTSTEGWQVSWMLLDSQKAVEVQYYGASILYFKISHNLKDISEDQLPELKNKFKQLLVTFYSGPKLVISKLCCVYSAFIIQVADESFTLLNCVNDVESSFKVLRLEPKFVILELLTVLPSEFKSLELGSNQKIIARHFMNDFISMILFMCNHVLQNTDQNEIKHQNDTLHCLLGWVEFGVSIFDSKDLLPLLFSQIACEELTDKICEVLVEMVTSPSSYNATHAMLDFLKQVLLLEGLIDEAISKENQDLLNNLCLLFANLGETHCRTFLKVKDSSNQMDMLNFVKIMIKFTSMKGCYPVDETCSELTFNFWYTLQDDLYAIDVEEITDYQKQFCDAYLMLVDIFHMKCQYPPDSVYDKYSSDDKEMLRCYRIEIQDTMLYVYTLLQERCLTYFSEKLKFLLSDPSSKWQQFESILHLLRGATESIDTTESTYLPKIISMLNQLPKHPKILDSLFFFLGSLSEWLNSHPEQVTNVLPFLLQGILNPDTATSCSIALKDICHECSLLLNNDAIMEVVHTCYKGLRAQNTSLKVVVRFFEIGGYVISALPESQMKSQLEMLTAPLFHWLKSILQQANVTTLSKKKVVHYLNCFYGLFRALDPFEELPVHPIVMIYGQLIPLFRVLKPWCGFEDVAVAATSCITKVLEVAREKVSEHVHVTSEVVAEFFLTQPYGCVLDTSSILIGMFGSETDCTDRIRNLFSLLTSTCIKMVEVGSSKEHPDCMQSFMNLLTRIIKSVPEFLYNDVEQQISLFKCVLILLTYQETPTIKNTCNFVVTYINFSSSYDNGKQIIEAVGRDIVIQSLLCISGVSPRHTTDHFADIILAFSKNFVTLLAVWLNDVFSNEGFPSVNASARQKEHFQKAILREKANKRRMKDMVRDFSLVCRGLNGMAYVR